MGRDDIQGQLRVRHSGGRPVSVPAFRPALTAPESKSHPSQPPSTRLIHTRATAMCIARGSHNKKPGWKKVRLAHSQLHSPQPPSASFIQTQGAVGKQCKGFTQQEVGFKKCG
eukprot:scaffold29531_cov18-Tisochrysis_lutea.AAC.1